MSLIKVTDAAFSYDTKRVLTNINLQVERGTICCLLGANGCGKSTLIDCVMGLKTLETGNITVDGRSVNEYRAGELARKIAYVPQIHQHSFPYTVQQIVLMGRTPYVRGMSGPGEKDKELVVQALENVGMIHLADRPYTQISGGEMQLVMLARALVQDTSIIVMDEPTAHLDYRNELIFLETTARLVREQSVSILMATHAPNQAFYLEDHGINVHIAAMADGTIVASGPPERELTEDLIRAAYGVEVRCISYQDNREGNQHQILPLRVLK